VYYDPRDQRLHKINNTYFMVIIFLVLGFMAFLFIEVIAIPIMKIKMP
jgi:hypothetical protein